MIFKHFPLPSHPTSRLAAEAARFAQEHGKFWEMHELIYENQRQLSLGKLKELGRQLGLDDAALQESVMKQAFKSSIDKDYQDGRKAQVSGTPTIFVNGKRVARRNLETFKQMIDAALEKSRQAKAAASARR